MTENEIEQPQAITGVVRPEPLRVLLDLLGVEISYVERYDGVASQRQWFVAFAKDPGGGLAPPRNRDWAEAGDLRRGQRRAGALGLAAQRRRHDRALRHHAPAAAVQASGRRSLWPINSGHKKACSMVAYSLVARQQFRSGRRRRNTCSPAFAHRMLIREAVRGNLRLCPRRNVKKIASHALHY